MNHYEALGVAPDAPLHEIRQAYLRSVLRSPGDEVDDAARRAAADAWAVLRSAERRAEYDASLVRPPSVPATAEHDDVASRLVSVLPPGVVAISIVLLLVALVLSSGRLLLAALLLLVVGLVSFVVIPLFDIARGR